MNSSDFPQPVRIPVNGVKLEVFEAGREDAGEPIVLCHGWPELAYSWRYQVPALVAAGYHVIVPNQRGYGNSARPPKVTDYDIEHLAGDLVALLDHYGYENATFVGHDWGAIVVWGLTLLHPDRVNKVINLSVPYPERGDVPWVDSWKPCWAATSTSSTSIDSPASRTPFWRTTHVDSFATCIGRTNLPQSLVREWR
ncbi:alpha/beta fold hydrolase [Rhodococcus sp. 077-4]|uniref:alpha/beta fold hydrolase n=1 Tax=Rhodococcus sp. 077-4 TaxID=2789271 RepID=UPI0039F59889